MSRQFRVAVVDYSDGAAALHAVRRAVFTDEQGIAPALEQDGEDSSSTHALALDDAGRPIAAGRLTAKRRIGRMAVLPAWRGHGVGQAVLDTLLERARADGRTLLTLHAQVTALPFYAHQCWLPLGPRHVEAGLEHQTMQRRLDGPLQASGADAVTAAVTSLAHRAGRRLQLRCPGANLDLLAEPSVVRALRRYAVAAAQRELHLLLDQDTISDPRLSMLRQLAQRVPTIVQVRTLERPDAEADPLTCALDDRGGWYLAERPGCMQGSFDPDGRARARRLGGQFDQRWQQADRCTQLRSIA